MARKIPPPPKPDSMEAWFLARNPTLKLASFQRILMLELERLASREVTHRRLMVMLPPGHGKTELGTFTFVPWYLARNPTHSVLVLSYDEKRSQRFGRKIRNACRTAAEQEDYPGLMPMKDSHASAFFTTEQGNEVYASGFNGPLAGMRTDCIPASVVLDTERGPLTVGDFIELPDRPRILGFNHETGKSEWHTVVAIQSRIAKSEELVEITTSAGRSLTLTGQHRVYSPPSGYTASNLLKPGDVLLAMPSGTWPVVRHVGYFLRMAQATIREAWIRMGLLTMPWFMSMGRTRQWQLIEYMDQAALHGRVPEDWMEQLSQGVAICVPPKLTTHLQSPWQKTHSQQLALLLTPRFWQFALQEWKHLRQTPQIEHDAVAMVGQARTETEGVRVYDLQVEGTNNFFANGILVHNCIVIDDPVKSMVEGRSEARMEEVFDIYRSVVKQRQKPGGIIVTYLTRYGMRDFAGRVMEAEGTMWKELMFPAEQPADSGRYLWPQYMGKPYYEEAKKDPEVWWSVMQQQPKQLRSHVFRPEWLTYWDVERGWVEPLPTDPSPQQVLA